ncbi:hypothetical protein Mco01_14820 [Microbispora corallina]|uniref:Uncharacterized protein n=1 Tax=Microbispora corallina TaxID=83302 RepID=A0ABQ4FUJ0_9ACTN|nr:hypothetical protein Mco01_14820 [Microbispora corallina]
MVGAATFTMETSRMAMNCPARTRASSHAVELRAAVARVATAVMESTIGGRGYR